MARPLVVLKPGVGHPHVSLPESSRGGLKDHPAKALFSRLTSVATWRSIIEDALGCKASRTLRLARSCMHSEPAQGAQPPPVLPWGHIGRNIEAAKIRHDRHPWLCRERPSHWFLPEVGSSWLRRWVGRAGQVGGSPSDFTFPIAQRRGRRPGPVARDQRSAGQSASSTASARRLLGSRCGIWTLMCG